MKIFFTDRFVLPLPEGHRFPMRKYAELRERVAAEGLGELEIPPAVADADLARIHTEDWIHRVRRGELSAREIRQTGFPWSPGLVERSRRSVGASLAAARAALRDGYGVNLAGGTHHAYAERGEGFCIFNDAAVAARTLQAEGRVRRVLIIDLDVHQGNGTARIFSDDPNVFTLSIHGRGNYPFRKERGDIDVALPDGTGDADYLEVLDEALEEGFDRGVPDLVIYLAGADPFHGDALGRLALTKEGLAARDERVFARCDALGLPVSVAMAGGYAPEIRDIVDIHAATVRAAAFRAGRRTTDARPREGA